jgi:hypothetical protein
LVSFPNKPAFSITSLEGEIQRGERFASYTMFLVLSKVTARSYEGDTHNFVKENRRVWMLDILHNNFIDRTM